MSYATWLWRKVVCITIGHNIDPCDCYATECHRCGHTFHFDKPPRNDIGFWLDWFEFKGWFRRKFLGRCCEVCGCFLKRDRGLICARKECSDEWMPF